MNLYKIEAATGQHLGDRDEQQDRVAIFAAPKAPGHVMAVIADGMGGMSGGALAADQVIRTAGQAFESFSPLTDDIDMLLRTIVHDAHTVLTLTALTSEKKPHSTIVLLSLTPDRQAIWAPVGDSRLYRFQGPN
ncbi:MAG: serine/threonine-protein phosphatase [Noviherbaspirillum sp.]|nr:serine/threonine-protein phosphatase [Noviherbaspirillum sp.]